MRGERVDGNDLLAVHAATRRARERAAAGEGPTLSSASPTASRATRPPTTRAPTGPPSWSSRGSEGSASCACAATSAAAALLDDAADEKLRAEAREELQRALKEAEAFAPKPPVETLFEDVYAEPLPHLREQLAELEEAIAADPRVANPRHSDA